MSGKGLVERFEERVREWNIVVENRWETDTSLLAVGRRGSQHVVLKLVKQQGDEWNCGQVLEAFDGRGVVRVYEHVPGAALLERLSPATSLAQMALNGRDEEATEILARVMQAMSPQQESAKGVPTVQEWAQGFGKYLVSGDNQIPIDLIAQGRKCISISVRRKDPLDFCTAIFNTTMFFLILSAAGWPSIQKASSASWNTRSVRVFATRMKIQSCSAHQKRSSEDFDNIRQS